MRRVVVRFFGGFVAGLLLFLVINLLVAHLRSDCGLPALLGRAGCADDIRRAGFPLLFLEQGGLSGRALLDAGALLIDALAGLVLALVAGLLWAWRR